MIEVLDFIFQSAKHFLGTVFLIALIGGILIAAMGAARGAK